MSFDKVLIEYHDYQMVMRVLEYHESLLSEAVEKHPDPSHISYSEWKHKLGEVREAINVLKVRK